MVLSAEWVCVFFVVCSWCCVCCVVVGHVFWFFGGVIVLWCFDVLVDSMFLLVLGR